MIFPPESIHEFRRELTLKMDSGTLSKADAFRQSLAVDPHDPAALRYLALTAEENGDLALAEQLGRRFVEANPLSHEGYALLGRLYAKSTPPLSLAYTLLSARILHYDPEELSDPEREVPDVPLTPPTSRKRSPANWNLTASSTNSSSPASMRSRLRWSTASWRAAPLAPPC